MMRITLFLTAAALLLGGPPAFAGPMPAAKLQGDLSLLYTARTWGTIEPCPT